MLKIFQKKYFYPFNYEAKWWRTQINQSIILSKNLKYFRSFSCLSYVFSCFVFSKLHLWMKDLEQPLEISPFPIDYCFCDIYLEDSLFDLGMKKEMDFKFIRWKTKFAIFVNFQKFFWMSQCRFFFLRFNLKAWLFCLSFFAFWQLKNLSDFFMTFYAWIIWYWIYCRFVDDFLLLFRIRCISDPF